MPEQVKSNTDVLKETPIESQQVNEGEFAKETAEATPSTQSTAKPDQGDSQRTPIVDVSNLPDIGVKFDDFEAAASGVEKPKVEVKPQEEKKVVEQPKVETKPAETKPSSQQKTEQHTASRDYSGFDADEVDALKKMSNQSFALVAPRLKQLKVIGQTISAKDNEIAQLKAGKQMLPDSYFEHPQAFVLTPEFNTVAKDLNDATRIQQHWREQMINIRKGEPWYDIDRDAKGNLVLNPNKKIADVNSEMEVMEYLNGSALQTQGLQQKMASLQSGFKERHTKAVSNIKQAENDHFKVYVEQGEKHPMYPVIKSVRDALPPEFKNNPLANLLSYSVAASVQFGNLYKAALAEIAELKKNGGAGTTKVESKQAAAGPTNGDLSANGGGGKQENLVGADINDFFKVMES